MGFIDIMYTWVGNTYDWWYKGRYNMYMDTVFGLTGVSGLCMWCGNRG